MGVLGNGGPHGWGNKGMRLPGECGLQGFGVMGCWSQGWGWLGNAGPRGTLDPGAKGSNRMGSRVGESWGMEILGNGSPGMVVPRRRDIKNAGPVVWFHGEWGSKGQGAVGWHMGHSSFTGCLKFWGDPGPSTAPPRCSQPGGAQQGVPVVLQVCDTPLAQGFFLSLFYFFLLFLTIAPLPQPQFLAQRSWRCRGCREG